MRVSSNLPVLLAVASTHVSAQSTSTSSASPATTSTSERLTGVSETEYSQPLLHLLKLYSDCRQQKLGDAPPVDDNPIGVVYKAVLPESAFFKPSYPDGGNIEGEITAVASDDGLGVRITIKLSNLPQTGASLPYHIHDKPVPENGNCTATTAHLDPYLRGQQPPCDASAPETCEVGDLSGKHGTIPTDQDTWETSYLELFASTLKSYTGFLGNRSIVIHYPNATRITCADFAEVDGGAELPDTSTSTSTSSCDTEEDTATATASTATSLPSHGTNSTATITSMVSTTPLPTSTPGATTTTSIVTAAASGLRTGLVSIAMVGAAVLFMF
ncbi:hypothetical protein N658DRAFT_114868 [Parathielavia hyrcaniae]|uniref:superoxide dismutase n=1 Tax=Parathielavia hyrcaniae TaxID=113614 RepID=A0AAN6QAQ1_9PEZI|nr:hypothetical protein N658DRAFT_114868 [Parathielavia hyrcaniae]